MIEKAILSILALLALPQVGLSTVFIVALISATLLPLGSEPIVFATCKANPDMFWWIILVAGTGNTLGGAVNYFLGLGAKQTFAKEKETVWFAWLKKYGSKTMLLTWLPIVGDPLATLGGWLKLPFWPCMMYMAVGKFLRYWIITSALLFIPDGFWKDLAQMFG